MAHPHLHSRTKRLFDVCFALSGLVIGSPLFLAISVAILFSSGRPIFFTQQRAGFHKKPFTLYKFRTMYVGAHRDQKKFVQLNQAPQPMFKIFDDPRFVGIGRFLSSIGLDELPQLWNVIRGDMSLVGPRPLPITEAKKLGKKWQFRFFVKPGIFSDWTVSPLRHTSEKSWLELDRKTVEHGSLFRDLHIIYMTIFKK